MKVLKRLSLFVVVLLSGLFLASCGAKTYSLTLGDNITANLTDLKKIAENTEITITIHEPVGQKLDYLFVNEQKINTDELSYSFLINSDTVINAHFKENEEDKYFLLVLPDNVTSSVINPEQVSYNTEVVLTIHEPVLRTFERLTINKEEVTSLTNNTYTFTLTETTVVRVYFKFADNWQPTTTLDLMQLSNSIKEGVILREGNLQINNKIIANDKESTINFKIELDEFLEIVKVAGKAQLDFENLDDYYEYYYDGELSYILKETAGKLTKKSYDNNILYFLINQLEEILDLDDLIGDKDVHFINYLYQDVFSLLVGALITNDKFSENFFFLKKGREQKIVLILNDDLISNIKGEFEENFPDDFDIDSIFDKVPEFEIKLEFYFNNFKPKLLQFEVTLGDTDKIIIQTEVSYTLEEVILPNDLDSYVKSEQEVHVYNIHVDGQMYTIEVKEFIVDTFVGLELSDEYKLLFENLLNRMYIDGFYLDEEHTIPLKISDFKNPQLDIYVLLKADAD